LHSGLVKIVIKELWELVDYKQKQIEWMAMVLVQQVLLRILQ